MELAFFTCRLRPAGARLALLNQFAWQHSHINRESSLREVLFGGALLADGPSRPKEGAPVTGSSHKNVLTSVIALKRNTVSIFSLKV